MEYTIGPLYSLEACKYYFRLRHRVNKQLFPQDTAYYQNRYELDYYDSFSCYYGVFLKGKDHPIGFLRITPNLLNPTCKGMKQSAALTDFISQALMEMNTPQPRSVLPSLWQFEDQHEDLHKRLNAKQEFAELGRLLSEEQNLPPFLPITLISFALAASIFQGIKLMLIRTSIKHAKIYHAYFSAAYIAVPKEGELFVPSLYDLESLSGKSQKLISSIHDAFQEAGQVIPLSFYNSAIQGKTISI